jgi:hypothetical protein
VDSEPDDVVLVRVYGHNTDLLIDRKAETNNFKVKHKINTYHKLNLFDRTISNNHVIYILRRYCTRQVMLHDCTPPSIMVLPTNSYRDVFLPQKVYALPVSMSWLPEWWRNYITSTVAQTFQKSPCYGIK